MLSVVHVNADFFKDGKGKTSLFLVWLLSSKRGLNVIQLEIHGTFDEADEPTCICC